MEGDHKVVQYQRRAGAQPMTFYSPRCGCVLCVRALEPQRETCAILATCEGDAWIVAFAVTTCVGRACQLEITQSSYTYVRTII